MTSAFGLQFKMLAVMAGAAAISIALSGGALYRAYTAMQQIEQVSRQESDLQQAIGAVHLAYRLQVNDWKNTLLRASDHAGAEKQWKIFVAREEEVAKRAQRARELAGGGDVGALLDKFIENHKRVGGIYHKAYDGFVSSGFDAAVGNKMSSGRNDSPDAPLLEADKKAEEHSEVAIKEAKAAGTAAFQLAIAAVAAAMLLAGFAIWYFLRRLVLAPVAAAVAAADRIAAGDLTGEIHAGSRDEMGRLLEALARMNGSLTRVVSDVRDAAEGVLAASGQVATGTTDLSQRTEEQASSLEETAASMEQLASTVKQNAENAREADRISHGARTRAEQGGAEVARVVETIRGISESAGRISDIISVIDGIAFQTNILALNAAVEAARAGEQGRGFAVVASEVRALAQRSAQAAREIKELIGASVGKVGEGTALVAKAGTTIEALVTDVKSVNELMGSIAEASEEQSRGVLQVNKTVTEMDRVVQQNAHAVQESASAAEAMRHQAGALIAAVRAFRTDAAPRMAREVPVAPREPRPAPRVAPPKPAPATPEKQKPVPALAGEEWEEF